MTTQVGKNAKNRGNIFCEYKTLCQYKIYLYIQHFAERNTCTQHFANSRMPFAPEIQVKGNDGQ